MQNSWQRHYWTNKKMLNNLRDGLPYPYTEKDGSDYIEAMLAADPNTTFAYAIIIDGKVAGSIGAFRQSNIHFRTAELGYYLGEEYWGNGAMTQAVRLLTKKLFDETDILRIYAEPFAYNTGSRRVLEKAGFQFEAPEYSKEGIDFFQASLDDEERTRALKFYGAFDGNQLVGTLCMREPQHIGGFFVKADYHRKGIGRALFETMRRDYDKQEFTVNSSPYAVKFYEHLGFQASDKEQVVNGLRFTPMICMTDN